MMDHFVDPQTNLLVRFGGKCFVPGTSLFGCFVLSAGREMVSRALLWLAALILSREGSGIFGHFCEL